MRSVEDDLTARARIRDAAIETIARRGFAATTVRAVATAAGVSPALVLHHFGSKDGLRQACDDAVWDEFHEVMIENADDIRAGDLFRQFSSKTEHSPAAGYVTRALLDGGEFAHRVFDGMVADVEHYMRSGVETGMIRAARDEHTRALMLTTYSLGSMLLGRYIVGEDADPLDIPNLLMDLFTEEGLDMFTEGLFIDPRIREAVRAAAEERHSERHPASGRTTTGRTTGRATSTKKNLRGNP